MFVPVASALSAALQWVAVQPPGVVECAWFVEIAAVSAFVVPVSCFVFYDDVYGDASVESGYRWVKRVRYPSLCLQEARSVLRG